jgi:hypothetical protein
MTRLPNTMMAASQPCVALLLALATTSANSVAASSSLAAAAGSATCSPQKACDFVQQLNNGPAKGPGGGSGPNRRISLLCTPAEECTISGTQLSVGEKDAVEMANVLVQNNTAKFGGLLTIMGTDDPESTPRGGIVTGTNLTFRNGHGSADSR